MPGTWGAGTKDAFLIINHNITPVLFGSHSSLFQGNSGLGKQMCLDTKPEAVFPTGASGYVLRNSFKDSLSFA